MKVMNSFFVWLKKSFRKTTPVAETSGPVRAGFAAAMRKAGDQYGIAFNAKDLFFLQTACAPQTYSAIVKKLEPTRYELLETTPALSLVVMAYSAPEQLQRCLFALEKQTFKNIEVIIVGQEAVPQLANLLKQFPVTFVTLSCTVGITNAHALVCNYAKGDYVTFIRSSDVLHPAYCSELMAVAETCEADMVVSRRVRDGRPLPPNPLPKTASIAVDGLDAPETAAWSPCVNDDLYGVLFISERWGRIARKKLAPELQPWAPFLAVLEYARGCSAIRLTAYRLLKETPESCGYSHLLLFSAALKNNFPALVGYLQSVLPSSHATGLIRAMLFRHFPAILGKLYATRHSTIRMSVIYSHIAFYLDFCGDLLEEDRYHELISVTFSSLYYCRYMSSPRVHAVHSYFVAREKYVPDGVCVYENDGLQDLQTHLLPLLRQKYRVIYLKKVKFSEYNQLEHLLFSIKAAQTVVILASFWIHRYSCEERQVLQLWHGNGLMKKILQPDLDAFRQEYAIASSEACREEYSQIFDVPPQNVLPFGTVQTDVYFESESIAQGKARAFAEFDDLADRRLCFFAPTFRQYRKTDAPSLYCHWDYAEADRTLAESNTLFIYKKHHMLKNVLRQQGINLTDLFDSPRRMIRESLLPDIFDWICACDVFITDYSSAMFFPLLLNKPIVFYTPDLDDFLTQGNGTLIDFRATVPGPIVESSSMKDLIAAVDEAPSYPGSEKYNAFKEYHMGACDGQARRRVLEFLDTWYSEQSARFGADQ